MNMFDWKKINRSIQAFFYPAICLHCNTHIDSGGATFCSICVQFFDFLEPEDSPAACFTYYGAVTTFVKVLKSKKLLYLSKTAASLLFLQFLHLHWPTPDIVIPVPCRSFLSLNDHVRLMAKHLAYLINTKWRQSLGRRSDRPRQTGLSREERMTLSPHDFILKHPHDIQGRTVLLIDDVMTTKSTLNSITTLLYQGGAHKVYALALAESFAAPLTCTRP